MNKSQQETVRSQQEEPAEPENNNSPCSSVVSVVEDMDGYGRTRTNTDGGKLPVDERGEPAGNRYRGWNTCGDCVCRAGTDFCTAYQEKLRVKRLKLKVESEDVFKCEACKTDVQNAMIAIVQFIQGLGDGSKLPHDQQARASEIRYLVSEIDSLAFALKKRVVEKLQSLCEHDWSGYPYDNGGSKCRNCGYFDVPED